MVQQMSHYGMPEPPPSYATATAPPLAQMLPSSSTNAMVSNTDEDAKFYPSTHFHQQQPPVQQHQPGQPQQVPMTAPPVAQQAPNPYILPPGAVPHAQIPPPGHYYQPGFIPAGPGIPIGPNTHPSNAGPIPTPMASQQNGQIKVIYAVPLGPHEAQLECTNCRQPVRTRVLRRPGLLAWLICGALALVGCWPCCIMPFCVQSCQDAEHYCPKCNAFIGKYARI